MDDKPTKRAEAPFRFLRPSEFAALTQDERIRYLQQAIEAVKSGRPLDDMPTRERH